VKKYNVNNRRKVALIQRIKDLKACEDGKKINRIKGEISVLERRIK